MNGDRGEFCVHQESRYLTSYAESVVPAFQRLSVTQKSLHYMGPRVWNLLPGEIRSITSFGLFKREAKKYFMAMSYLIG